MSKITYITRDSESITVEATSGTIMELAIQHGVEGIDGNCGGVCSCGTCHVHISPEYFEKVGPPSEIEQDMLELDDNVSEYSRLGCQIEISETLDGLVLHVAQ